MVINPEFLCRVTKRDGNHPNDSQLAAANGDLIFYTGEDAINVFNLLTGAGTTGTITGVWTITGGTGRFAGATGAFDINGPVDFTTSIYSVTGVGTIVY